VAQQPADAMIDGPMTALQIYPAATPTDVSPCIIRGERASDEAAREALLDACFGENRHARTCQRFREGRAPAQGLAFSVIRGGKLVATVRLWDVNAGGTPAVLLGPLAVDPSCRGLGLGTAIVHRALAAAQARRHPAVVLLGDPPYYSRFGFSAEKTGRLALPGAFETHRLLALELQGGALDGAAGMITPSGALLPKSRAIRARPAHARNQRAVRRAA
jgi:predicted N-acetyltransferase YhbS